MQILSSDCDSAEIYANYENQKTMNCELCRPDLGEVIIKTALFRVVLVDDANYPGYCRLIWNGHAREMTDLSKVNLATMWQALSKLEDVVRKVMRPDKINLASLGNATPHLHWHVIPRYQDDANFPDSIWASTDRQSKNVEERRALLPKLRLEVAKVFRTWS